MVKKKRKVEEEEGESRIPALTGSLFLGLSISAMAAYELYHEVKKRR